MCTISNFWLPSALHQAQQAQYLQMLRAAHAGGAGAGAMSGVTAALLDGAAGRIGVGVGDVAAALEDAGGH